MDSTKISQYLGRDGIQYLDLAIGLTNRNLDVMVFDRVYSLQVENWEVKS